MKATLTFTLPAEQEEHQIAVDAIKWRNIVVEIDQYLRKCMKYDNIETMRVEDLRRWVNQAVDDEGLTL